MQVTNKILENYDVCFIAECSSNGILPFFFLEMLKTNSFSWIAMLSDYSKCATLDFALMLLPVDVVKNVVMWTSMIAGSKPKKASSAGFTKDPKYLDGHSSNMIFNIAANSLFLDGEFFDNRSKYIACYEDRFCGQVCDCPVVEKCSLYGCYLQQLCSKQTWPVATMMMIMEARLPQNTL